MASCKNVADLFGAYIYGDLPPDEMKKLRLHIDECEECARELEIQSRVISMIPSEVPALSDEERQRIEWTVKGAIRAKEKPVRIGLFSPAFIKGFAFTTAVVAAFAAGTAIGLRSKPVKENTIVKTAPAEPAEKKPAISQPPDSVAEQPKETIPTDSVIPVRQELAVSPPRRDEIQLIWRGSDKRKPINSHNGLIPGLGQSEKDEAGADKDNQESWLPFAPIPDGPNSADLSNLSNPGSEKSLDEPVMTPPSVSVDDTQNQR